ncbi:MAG: hypothetical protein P0116_16520 [Candidatus Nitrosocosmicus sp.]|nr:hypothetical protein [Candidatus Nitrosocosmicus sp.]
MRQGDKTNSPSDNEATDRAIVSKMANLLEGLQFPATTEEIKNHLNKKSPAMGNRIYDVLEAIQNNLNQNSEYQDVYDIALSTGLVKKKN